MIRASLGLLLALLLCLGGVGPALGHATLVAAVPADGAVLAAPPVRFALTFNEAVSPLALKLIRPGGATATLDRVGVRGPALDIVLPSGLSEGTHMLSWRVVSEDGHPVSGSIVFSIGQPGAVFAGTGGDTLLPVRVAIWLAKAVLYLALFVGIGGAFFRAWMEADAAAVLIKASMLAGLAAAPVSMGLQGLDALAEPLPSLLRWPAWQAGFATSHGTAICIALPALLAGLLSFHTAAKALSLSALLGIGACLAASGHASSANPQWLTRPAVFLHGVGLSFWIGALVPLAALLRIDAAAARTPLRRFSRAIPAALAILVLAGLVLAVVQVDRPGSLWTTAYGWILSAKLLLLLLLLGLAALNRISLSVDPAAASALRRSIRMEILLVTGILGLVALWRFTPPPRALAPVPAASVHIHTDRAMADLRLQPGRVGRVSASIDLMTGDIEALEAKEVTLVLFMPEMGIEPVERPARKTDVASWQVDDLPLPVAGRWSVRIDILVSDFELLKLSDTIEIAP